MSVEIENLLQETRKFPPSKEFVSNAVAKPELYEEAKKGIPLLSREARISVALALVLYREILSEIEKAEEKNYPMFSIWILCWLTQNSLTTKSNS